MRPQGVVGGVYMADVAIDKLIMWYVDSRLYFYSFVVLLCLSLCIKKLSFDLTVNLID